MSDDDLADDVLSTWVQSEVAGAIAEMAAAAARHLVVVTLTFVPRDPDEGQP